MVFAAPLFVLAFLPLIIALNFMCPRPLRNALLLAASLLFYAWGEVDAFLVLVVATVANWLVAPLLVGGPPARRRRALAIAVTGNLLPLLYFKYASFFAASLTDVLTLTGVELEVVVSRTTLPLGISFYTFQAISFLVDVHRQRLPRGSLVGVFLYTTFFPGMVAGPIERYADIEPQLHGRETALDDLFAGVVLFVRGLCKKLLLANPVAVVADDFFALPATELTPGYAWLAIGCYTLQIYYDFSGYSDMAVGLARMFGFRYPANFDRPYVSGSITEFWRRWHITLSTWFRDYVYIPLGGNRGAPARTYRNLVVVFLLCGLWHGAAWTFLAWGAWHGGWLVVERAGLARLLVRLPGPLASAWTLLLVMMGWVLFRADSLAHAGAVFASLAGRGASTSPGAAQWSSPYLAATLAVGTIAALLPHPAVERAVAALTRAPRAARIAVCALTLGGFLGCLLALAARTHNPFIYYRF